METQWSDWLAAERAAGRGGIVWPEPIVRGLPFTMVLPIPVDVSADAFVASLRISPDAPDPTLADFTVSVGAYASGVTPVTLSLSEAQVVALDASAGDGDGDGLAEVVFDLLYTPSGGSPIRSAALVIPISGKVTDNV